MAGSKRELGTKPQSDQPKTPVVFLKGKEGTTFIGKYAGSRDVKYRGKMLKVYEFNIVDGDAPTRINVGPKKYQDVDVNAGDIVSVFGTTVLDNKLLEAKKGETIEITYLGMKPGRNGGADYHDFYVAVLE